LHQEVNGPNFKGSKIGKEVDLVILQLSEHPVEFFFSVFVGEPLRRVMVFWIESALGKLALAIKVPNDEDVLTTCSAATSAATTPSTTIGGVRVVKSETKKQALGHLSILFYLRLLFPLRGKIKQNNTGNQGVAGRVPETIGGGG
jgi:hypothetical protein